MLLKNLRKNKKEVNYLRVTYLFLWVLLVGYAGVIMFTYPNLLNDVVFQELMKMKLNDPLLMSLFLLMGILPLLYLLYALRYHHRFWTLVPVFLSFVIGAFSLLLFMAFLNDHTERPYREKNFMRVARSPLLYSFLAIGVFFLLLYGLLFGSFVHYVELIRSSPFVAIMTADFLVLTLLPYAIINLDPQKVDYPVVYGIPWFGFILYLFQFYRHPIKQTPTN